MNAPSSIPVTHAITIADVEGEAFVPLTPAMLARLGVGLGDQLEIVEDGDRMLLRRKAQSRPEQMVIMREVMERRRKALAELAK